MTIAALDREQVLAIIHDAGPYSAPLGHLRNSMWNAFFRSRTSRFIAAGMASQEFEEFRQKSEHWAEFFVAASGGRYDYDAVLDCIDSVKYQAEEIAVRIVQEMIEGADGPFDRRAIPESLTTAMADAATLFPDSTTWCSVFGIIVSDEEAAILVPYLQERHEGIKDRRR